MSDANRGLESLIEVAFLLESAELLATAGRHCEARATFVAGVDLDTGHTARTAFGCFLMKTECYEEALEQFVELLDEARQTSDAGLRSMAASNLAAVYRASGQTEMAIVYQQQAIKSGQSVVSTELTCELSNRACDAILAGDFYLAENLLKRSLALEQLRQSLDGQACDLGNLGVVAGLRGAYSIGIQYFWAAYELHEQMADQHGIATDLINISQLFGKLMEWQTAVKCLRHAIRRLESITAAVTLERATYLLEEAVNAEQLHGHDPQLN